MMGEKYNQSITQLKISCASELLISVTGVKIISSKYFSKITYFFPCLSLMTMVVFIFDIFRLSRYEYERANFLIYRLKSKILINKRTIKKTRK